MAVKLKKQKGLPPPPPPAADNGDEEMDAQQSQSEEDEVIKVGQKDSIEDDGNGLEQQSLDGDDDDIQLSEVKTKKRKKKGIIYVSNIPKHMNVTRIREILGAYGEIGRVFLQPEKLPGSADKKKKKKRKPFARHFTEGWVEFKSKRVAKQIVPLLNNKQISSRKKSQFFDYLWSMKYLPRFKWTHLTERMNYEQAVHKQRLMTEVSQARKETTFFQNNLDKSEFIKKKNKKNKGKTTEGELQPA